MRRAENVQRDKAVLDVRHVTTYRYARPVEFGEHRMMMRPRDGHDQRLVSSELLIEPRPTRLRWLYDAFDNCVALGSFSGVSTSLSSRAASRSNERQTTSPAARSIRARVSIRFPMRPKSFLTSPARSSGCTTIRTSRPLGSSVRDSRRDDADEPSLDDADLCDQGRIFLRAARRSPACSRRA